jgi:hypothetical protein
VEESLRGPVEGRPAAVALVREPLPQPVLAEACAAAWYWPEAAVDLRRHAAQLLVALLPDEGEPIGGALVLTRLAAAVAKCSGASGVYWSAAGLVHAPDAFLAEAQAMSRDRLPLALWLKIAVEPEPGGTHSVRTTGLELFAHREIEVYQSRREPRSLWERVYNIAHYVLDHGPVLKHGHTVGGEQDERFLVTFGQSLWEPDRAVIQIEL